MNCIQRISFKNDLILLTNSLSGNLVIKSGSSLYIFIFRISVNMRRIPQRFPFGQLIIFCCGSSCQLLSLQQGDKFRLWPIGTQGLHRKKHKTVALAEVVLFDPFAVLRCSDGGACTTHACVDMGEGPQCLYGQFIWTSSHTVKSFAVVVTDTSSLEDSQDFEKFIIFDRKLFFVKRAY